MTGRARVQETSGCHGWFHGSSEPHRGLASVLGGDGTNRRFPRGVVRYGSSASLRDRRRFMFRLTGLLATVMKLAVQLALILMFSWPLPAPEPSAVVSPRQHESRRPGTATTGQSMGPDR